MDVTPPSGSSGIPPRRPNRKKARREERIKQQHHEDELRAERKREKDRPRKKASKARKRAFQKEVEEQRSKINLRNGEQLPKEEYFAQLAQRSTEEAELLNRLKTETEVETEVETETASLPQQSWIGWGLSIITAPIMMPLRAMGLVSSPKSTERQASDLSHPQESHSGHLKTFMPSHRVSESSRPVLSDSLEKQAEHREDSRYSREHRDEYKSKARKRVHDHASKMESKPGRGSERAWVAALKEKQEAGHEDFSSAELRRMKSDFFNESDRARPLVKLTMEDIPEESESESEDSVTPTASRPERTYHTCATGFAAPDQTSFVHASLKALLAGYPEEYFATVRDRPLDNPEAEAVRQAFIQLLNVTYGHVAGSENAQDELKALLAAVAAMDQSMGIINPVFQDDGTVISPQTAQQFLESLMVTLECNVMLETSGVVTHYTVPDQKQWGSQLPPCLASGIPTPGMKEEEVLVGSPVMLPVTLGDDTQTVQSCLNNLFAPKPMEDGQSFYVTRKSLGKLGYRQGQNPMLDYKLDTLPEGEQRVAMPVKSKGQPRLRVDLDKFESFSVSMDIFGGEGGCQLARGGEAQTITQRSGEYITVPVTDVSTGQHYLVKMRQKTFCGYNESSGTYITSVREGEQWRTHNGVRVGSRLQPNPWRVSGIPHFGSVIFYEKVGEPIPVASADVICLEQNVVEPGTMTSWEHSIEEKIKGMTGRAPKLFREGDGDVLITDITRPENDTSRFADHRLYNHLKSLKHNDQPLVRDEAEFIVLCSGIPKAVRRNFEEMEKALRIFRLYQDAGPHPDCFPPTVFSHLYNRGRLLEVVCFNPGASKKIRDEEYRRGLTSNIENAMGDVKDFPGVIILDRNLGMAQQANVELVAPGLGNFGNTCFMNSSLVALSDSLHRSGALQNLREQRIPLTVARDMVRFVYPKAVYSPDADAGRKEYYEQQREEAADKAARDAIEGKGPYAARFFNFKEYYKFRDAFVTLMDAMHPVSGERPVPPELVSNFFRAYQSFSQFAQKLVAREIFGDCTAEEVALCNISQHDPTEFMGDICSLLGIDNHPDSAVVTPSVLQMIDKDGQVRLQRQIGAAEYSPDIKVEITGMEKPTLPGLCECFLKGELLEKGAGVETKYTHKWGDDDYALAGIAEEDRDSVRSRKKLVLTFEGHQPPRRLMISPKMFDMNMLGKQRLTEVPNKKTGKVDIKLKKIPDSETQYGDSYKTVVEGKLLIRETDISKTIKLPFTKFPEPGVFLSRVQNVEEEYSIKSIVCHSGDKPKSGHYITVKFENGKTTIYDDSAVFDLSKAHIFHDVEEPFTDWKDYLLRTQRYPYTFCLEASPPEFPGREAAGGNVFDFPIPVEGDGNTPEVPELDFNGVSVPAIETNPPAGASGPVRFGKISVVSGDICKLKDQWDIGVDAVVNAANEHLEKGSGVCGAIFKAAGTGAKKLQDECRQFKGCPPGEARTTRGYDLGGQGGEHIIHAVGPDMRDKKRYEGSPELAEKELKSAYQAAMAEAQSRGMKKIAMPALSSGVFGFDDQRGIGIAAEAIREYHGQYPGAPDVVFVLFHDGSDSGQVIQGDQLRESMEAVLSASTDSEPAVSMDMDTPPVLVWHCEQSSEHATDPVAKMNCRLFEALNSVPLVEGASDREGWASWAWRMMMTYDNYTPPERLVQSKNEFVRMFRSVPAEYRREPDKMVHAVRRFKALMAKTPTMTPGMFSHMLIRGDLDSAKNISDVIVDIDEIRSETDMPVVDPSLLVGAPLKFYPGFDSGHVDSAMQCSLHVMARNFTDDVQIEQIGSEAIPDHIVRELVSAQLSGEEIAQGAELLERRVRELKESRGKMGARRGKIEEPYTNFQTDFTNLMREMNAPVPGDSLAHMYQGFLESYKALCAATGRPVPAILRERRNPALPQPSVHELMQQMMDLLGMHNHPNYALKASEHFSLGDEGADKCQKSGQTFQGAMLPMPLPSKVANPCLQTMVLDCAGQTEMIERTVAGVWSQEDRKGNAITEDDLKQLKTRRSVTFECLGGKPPEHLMFNIEAPTSGGFSGSTLAKDVADLVPIQIKEVMSNTSTEIPVGIPLKDSEGKTAVVNYRVQDIVCRRVDRGGKAHYLTVQFRNNKPYVCDGSVRVKLENYVSANGKRDRYENWMQFCAAENLQVSSVTLVRDPDSRDFEGWHKNGSYESEVELGRSEFQARLNDIREQKRLTPPPLRFQ